MMYTYNAVIKSVYDGDGSFDANIDLGFKMHMLRKVRLFGIDAPEIRGHTHDAGIVVRDFVRDKILNKQVVLYTHKDKTGKYGRLLVDLFINHISLNLLLINAKLAKPYDGGKRSEWTDDELNYIIGANHNA